MPITAPEILLSASLHTTSCMGGNPTFQLMLSQGSPKFTDQPVPTKRSMVPQAELWQTQKGSSLEGRHSPVNVTAFKGQHKI